MHAECGEILVRATDIAQWKSDANSVLQCASFFIVSIVASRNQIVYSIVPRYTFSSRYITVLTFLAEGMCPRSDQAAQNAESFIVHAFSKWL